jgi:hypothetical protein
VHVDEAVSPAEVLGVVGEEVVGAAVEAVASQQVIPARSTLSSVVVTAAMPDAVATAACAPSRAASLSCRYR